MRACPCVNVCELVAMGHIYLVVREYLQRGMLHAVMRSEKASGACAGELLQSHLRGLILQVGHARRSYLRQQTGQDQKSLLLAVLSVTWQLYNSDICLQAVTLPVAWERVVELGFGQRPTDAPGLRLFLEVQRASVFCCHVYYPVSLAGPAWADRSGVSLTKCKGYAFGRCRSWGATPTLC